ncbi:MAG: hypothetical protein HQM09_08800 [Candidatus Riflebacteria bacterium]|nr:hypothetical protein [Candidatus Riflebacteria bacterium]
MRPLQMFVRLLLMGTVLLISHLAAFGEENVPPPSQKDLKAKSCVANMRVLSGALKMYEMNHSQPMKVLDMEILKKEGYLSSPIRCPGRGDYSIKCSSEGNSLQCSKHGTIGVFQPSPKAAGILEGEDSIEKEMGRLKKNVSQNVELAKSFLESILEEAGSKLDTWNPFSPVCAEGWCENYVESAFSVPEEALPGILHKLEYFAHRKAPIILENILVESLLSDGKANVKRLGLRVYYGTKAPIKKVFPNSRTLIAGAETLLQRIPFSMENLKTDGNQGPGKSSQFFPGVCLRNLRIDSDFRFLFEGCSQHSPKEIGLEETLRKTGNFKEMFLDKADLHTSQNITLYFFQLSGRL